MKKKIVRAVVTWLIIMVLCFSVAIFYTHIYFSDHPSKSLYDRSVAAGIVYGILMRGAIIGLLPYITAYKNNKEVIGIILQCICIIIAFFFGYPYSIPVAVISFIVILFIKKLNG